MSVTAVSSTVDVIEAEAAKLIIPVPRCSHNLLAGSPVKRTTTGQPGLGSLMVGVTKIEKKCCNRLKKICNNDFKDLN